MSDACPDNNAALSTENALKLKLGTHILKNRTTYNLNDQSLKAIQRYLRNASLNCSANDVDELDQTQSNDLTGDPKKRTLNLVTTSQGIAFPSAGILTVNSPDASVLFGSTAGVLTMTSTSLLGNVLRVDAIYGNDTTAALNNTLPFLTITAALAAAGSGDTIIIMPGTYAESFTIPTGVSVQGLNPNGVIISRSVSLATDLITMGENSRLSNVTLSLTSSSHVQLRGIVFPDTTYKTATVNAINLTVNNSSAGAGNSIVTGIQSVGSGSLGTEFPAVNGSTVTVNSTGSGAKRGILVSTANDFHIRDTKVTVTNAGAGSAIGVETSNASAIFTAHNATISGTNTGTPTAAADISQTTGSIILTATDLVNANANALGFSTRIAPTIIAWADSGNLAPGTNFMHVGTDNPGTQMFVRCNQKLIVKSLAVQSASAPGSTDTWTLFKNGIATGLTVSLTGSATGNVNASTSVSFAATDRISLRVVRGNIGSTEVVVTMELY